jgi:uncharacterized protein
MNADEPVTLAGLPMRLRWLAAPLEWTSRGDASLSIAAGPRTDWFVDPGGAAATLNAPALVGDTAATGYMLSARVRVEFASTFDAGALFLHADERTWAKLAFERAPDGRPMIVSVVTRVASDDCNSFVVDGSHVWLRIARRPPAFAFHASTDGRHWQFIRHFALGTGGEPAVGFLAQAPRGAGCSVDFDEIRFAEEELRDLRSGD